MEFSPERVPQVSRFRDLRFTDHESRSRRCIPAWHQIQRGRNSSCKVRT